MSSSDSPDYGNSTSWAPPGETSADIFSEHTWLQGAFLGAVAFGMQIILYFMSVYLLWNQRNRNNSRRNLLLIGYISVIFIQSILYMVGLFQFTQLSFIDDRNIPKGPNAFENVEFSLPIDMLANAIMVILTWMCDIINVWRCIVVYWDCGVSVWLVMALPGLLYLASVVTGVLFLIQVGGKSQSPWLSTGINWTIPYYSMSLALNILVTILIVGRLLVYRRRMAKALGETHAAQYTSVAAVIVESALMYSSFSILFLVPFGLKSTLAQLWLQPLSPVQVVSTFLIIFRVAQGKAWNHQTGASMATQTIGGSSTGRMAPLRVRTVKSTWTDGQETTTTAISLQQMKSEPVNYESKEEV